MALSAAAVAELLRVRAGKPRHRGLLAYLIRRQLVRPGSVRPYVLTREGAVIAGRYR